jgi:hypothetical protein
LSTAVVRHAAVGDADSLRIGRTERPQNPHRTVITIGLSGQQAEEKEALFDQMKLPFRSTVSNSLQ